MTDRTPTTEAGRRQVEGLREAAQLCLRCGKVHVRQEGPTPKSAPSWADPSDGHTYRPESWEAVAHRLAATPPAPALDVERRQLADNLIDAVEDALQSEALPGNVHRRLQVAYDDVVEEANRG